MSIAQDLMAAIQLANDSYKSGHDEGWKAGVRAGVAACRRVVDGEDMDKVVDEVIAQGKSEEQK